MVTKMLLYNLVCPKYFSTNFLTHWHIIEHYHTSSQFICPPLVLNYMYWLTKIKILEDNIWVTGSSSASSLPLCGGHGGPEPSLCLVNMSEKGRFQRLESRTIFDQIKKTNFFCEDLIVYLWNTQVAIKPYRQVDLVRKYGWGTQLSPPLVPLMKEDALLRLRGRAHRYTHTR